MFSDEEWTGLVDRLITQTELQHLEWKRQTGSPKNLQANIALYAYVVGSVDQDDAEPYFLSVYVLNTEGGNYNRVDRITSTMPADGTPWDDLPQLQQNVVKLWSVAYRSVSGGIDVVAKMYEALDNLTSSSSPSKTDATDKSSSDEPGF